MPDLSGRTPSSTFAAWTLYGPVPRVRQDWIWICEVCGWKGVGCPSYDFARREASRHNERDHP